MRRAIESAGRVRIWHDKGMSSVPNLPAELPEIDDETQRVLAERLRTLEEDEKAARSWADVKAEILRKLERPASR
jgi:septation ring formation regulator EzrA